MKKTYILFEAHSLCNGSLVDCLDLLLWTKKHGIDIGIALIKKSEDIEDLKNITNTTDILEMLYHTRYCGYLSESYIKTVFEDDIITIDRLMIPIYIKNAVIFDYTTFLSCKNFLKNTKVFFVSNLLQSDLSSAIDFEDNITIAGESQFDFIINEPYRQKYLLNALKQCYTPEKNKRSLVICPGYSIFDIENGFRKKIWGEIKYNFNTFDYVLRNSSSVISGVYNNINEVIYFQSPVVYDRKPRTLLEAVFLGIPVHYHYITNPQYAKVDGSSIRNINIKYELDNREYSFDDKLIKWIISNE